MWLHTEEAWAGCSGANTVFVGPLGAGGGDVAGGAGEKVRNASISMLISPEAEN